MNFGGLKGGLLGIGLCVLKNSHDEVLPLAPQNKTVLGDRALKR